MDAVRSSAGTRFLPTPIFSAVKVVSIRTLGHYCHAGFLSLGCYKMSKSNYSRRESVLIVRRIPTGLFPNMYASGLTIPISIISMNKDPAWCYERFHRIPQKCSCFISTALAAIQGLACFASRANRRGICLRWPPSSAILATMISSRFLQSVYAYVCTGHLSRLPTR